MSASLFAPPQPLSSPLHRLDARVKLALALAYILTTALAPQGAWAVYVLLWALITAAAVLSELGVGWVYRRSLIALPFALAALPLVFSLPGPAWFSLRLGSLSLTASLPGAERAASILLKVWLSVQAGILLSATTRQTALLAAMRALKLPRLLVAVMGLMWRYLDLMLAEARRLLRARASRSARSAQPGLKTGGTVTWRAKVTGGMAGSLMLRSLERSERVYQAMLARGYDGEAREAQHRPLAAAERWLLVGGYLVLLMVNLLALLWK